MKKTDAIQKLCMKLNLKPTDADGFLAFLDKELGLSRVWEPEPSLSPQKFAKDERVLVLGYSLQDWGTIESIEWVGNTWSSDFKHQWGYKIKFEGRGVGLFTSSTLVSESSLRKARPREYFQQGVSCPYCPDTIQASEENQQKHFSAACCYPAPCGCVCGCRDKVRYGRCDDCVSICS